MNDYKSDFCYEGGYIKTFCFFEEKFTSTENRTIADYGIMFSIIPPPSPSKGCFINVWHENSLLSTLRISFSGSTSQKNKETDEQQGWRIAQDNVGFKYNRYHYRISNRVMLKDTRESKGIVKTGYKLFFGVKETLSLFDVYRYKVTNFN